MYYKLTDHTALRSWQLVPYAYYTYGQRLASGLKEEEFNLLLKCDGNTALEESPLLEELINRDLCQVCEKGEVLGDWQKVRYCDNRYFPAMNWTITGKCNFNCMHCFMAADNSALMEEFSYDQAMNLLDGIEKTGMSTLSLTGGEPMLHPHFMEIVRECARRRIDINEVITNGSFITEEKLDEFISLGLSPIFKISFDGIGHHDWFRGMKGAEEKTLAAIKLVHDKGFSVLIQMNIHKDNVHTIMPTLKLFDEMGIEAIRIIRTTEAPRWNENGKDLCLGIEEYYDLSLKITEDYLKTNPQMDVDIWMFLQYSPRSRDYHLRPVEGGVKTYRASAPVCRGNRGMVAVIANGDIVPCNQVSGQMRLDKVLMGNVHATPLNKLLSEGPYLDSVTFTVGELQERNPECQACDYWKLCVGGCRACAYAFNGTMMSYDPIKCIYFKKGYMDQTIQLFSQFEGYRCVDDI